MKVGFVLECHENGAEHQVLKFLLETFRFEIEPVFRFMGNKGTLFREVGEWVEGLFVKSHCVRVFVVWDLVPPEVCDERGKKSCRAEREAVLERLREEDRAPDRTTLLCLSHELEAWLLTDGAAIESFLYEKKASTHRKSVSDGKHTERDPNPKKTLSRIFQAHRGAMFEYSDLDHAIKLVKAAHARDANLSKYRRALSFNRLLTKLDALRPGATPSRRK